MCRLHIFSTNVEGLQRFTERIFRRLRLLGLQLGLLMKRENPSLFQKLVCSVFHENKNLLNLSKFQVL